MLRVDTWRTRLNNASAHAAWEAHARSVHNCACILKPLNGAWVIANLNTNFFQNCVCVVFKNLQSLFRDKFVWLDQPREVGLALRIRRFTG